PPIVIDTAFRHKKASTISIKWISPVKLSMEPQHHNTRRSRGGRKVSGRHHHLYQRAASFRLPSKTQITTKIIRPRQFSPAVTMARPTTQSSSLSPYLTPETTVLNS